MKSDCLQFLFYVISFVLGGAAEEFMPKVFGVGVPVLLALAICTAIRKSAVTMVLVALAAGACEDALSSLPAMTSPCFFLAAAVLARKTRVSKLGLVLAYPVYQAWLNLLVPEQAESLGVRCLAATPIAVLVSFVSVPFFTWLERKAAVDET